MTPAQVLKARRHQLLDYETSEILNYNHVYFLGHTDQKIASRQKKPIAAGGGGGGGGGGSSGSPPNHGFDDERGDYLITLHDHIGYRYEVLKILGKGT